VLKTELFGDSWLCLFEPRQPCCSSRKRRLLMMCKRPLLQYRPGEVCSQSIIVQIWQFLCVKCVQATSSIITMSSNCLSKYKKAQSSR